MGLKIKIAIPFLPNYVKEVEFDDFERIDIGVTVYFSILFTKK